MSLILQLRRSYSASAEFKDLFKSSMSRVSSQAMILTAGFNHKREPNPVLHGMTVSSVCSLSLNPRPLLQFNLHLPSYTSRSLHENHGVLAIHLFPPTKKSVKLGRVFAGGIKDSDHDKQMMKIQRSVQELKDGEIFHEMTTPFKNISRDDWELHRFNDEIDIPILKEAERIFICKKKQVFSIDMHEIWAIEVLDILCPNPQFKIDDNGNKSGGILYFDRAFHSIGNQLEE